MFKAVYAFLGEDEVRMQAKAKSLIENAVTDEYRVFNLDQFSPGDASPMKIEEAALAYPLGEGRRIVLVRDLNGFSAEEQEAIVEMANRFAQLTDSTTTLALLAPGLNRKKRIYRRLLDLDKQPSGQIVTFEAPPQSRIDSWVTDRATERGIQIASEAAQLLVDLVGDDLRVLDGELTKLELYLGTGAPVNEEVVEAVVGRRRGEAPWDLPRRLFEGDRGGAERIVTRLLTSGEDSVFILNVITRYVLEANQISLMLTEGASRGNIIQEVGLRDFAADRAITTAGKIPPEAFPRMLKALKECDRGLKSRSGKQNEILIHQLIGRLVVESDMDTGLNGKI